MYKLLLAAAFGRLCVETRIKEAGFQDDEQPPSGGCVLKLVLVDMALPNEGSRLRAAVC